MSWAVWITGLPGSGKSTVALKVKEKVPDAVILRIDELRKIVTPAPTYSGEEREYVYKALVYTAKTVYDLGRNVIIDATGNRQLWRKLARIIIPDYYEVYLKCSLDLCKEREKTRIESHSAPEVIYEKGEKGWPVPGVNAPYDEPLKPELVIDTETTSPEEAAEKIIHMVNP
jgi:adenylylsulfate kinase